MARIADNLNARSITIGIDVTGKLKVKATVAGAGSTAPGTLYTLIFDDYGWTASTPSVASSSLVRSMIGIAEGVVTSKLPTGVGLSTQIFEFVVGGPTILQSTLAAGTTGQSLRYSTAGISATGATFAGLSWEFAVYRNAFSPYVGGYTTSPLLSTKETVYGNLSTGTQAIMLTGNLTQQG